MYDMATTRKPKARAVPAATKAHPIARTMFALRLPAETLAALDAWVEALNNEPGRMGRVHRSDLLEKVITDAVKSRAASKGEGP